MELIRRGEEHFVEKSSDDGSQCTSEDLDESLSDDEVIISRLYRGMCLCFSPDTYHNIICR